MNEVRDTRTPWDSMKCFLALSISRYSSRVNAMVVLLGLLRLLLVIIQWSMFNGYVKNTTGYSVTDSVSMVKACFGSVPLGCNGPRRAW